MSEPTAARAASVLFNLPGYRVVQVVRDEAGGRTVTVETETAEAACPSCGVFTSAVHQRTMQRVRDVDFDGWSPWCGARSGGAARKPAAPEPRSPSTPRRSRRGPG